MQQALSFDDVMLIPRLSNINSRGDVDLSTSIAGIKLKIPIIAANMSSVCGVDMAIKLGDLGGLGIIHRMCSIEEQAKMVSVVCNYPVPAFVSSPLKVGFSIGIGPDWRERMDACRNNANIVCLDIAHAHHQRVLYLLKEYFEFYQNYPIIIGQVATPNAVRDILNIIPEQYHSSIAFKTSIGGGSLCTTRIKTGFGIPTLQAVMNIKKEFSKISIIADGGIRESGDIVKSLALGANAVMLGNLLAGTEESPGGIIKGNDGKLYKIYRGSSSYGDKSLRGEEIKNIEGEEILVSYKGSVIRVITNLLDGIRSGFSYGGVINIEELQDSIEYIQITNAGMKESLPHGLFNL